MITNEIALAEWKMEISQSSAHDMPGARDSRHTVVEIHADTGE
jgi:hypothetical protein